MATQLLNRLARQWARESASYVRSARRSSRVAANNAYRSSTKRANSPPGNAWKSSSTTKVSRRSASLRKHRATYFGMADKELPADGVVTGCATVDGRLIHLASQDFTVAGGAAGEVHCAKITEMMQLSMKTGSPFVFINDSGGARVQEGIDSLAGYASVFYNNVMLSGTVPQISIICGPCAGGAAYSPALTDFIIQTKRAQMFITGSSGHQAGDGRESYRGPARRSRGPDESLRRCSPDRRGRRWSVVAVPAPVELPAVEQPGGPSPAALQRQSWKSTRAERYRARQNRKLATTFVR